MANKQVSSPKFYGIVQTVALSLSVIFGSTLIVPVLLPSLPPAVPPVCAQSTMSDGIKKFGAKDYSGAIKVFTDYVKVNPQSADAYYYLAASYHRQNRTDDARKLYEYVDKNFPGSQAAVYSQTSLKSLAPSGAASAARSGPSSKIPATTIKADEDAAETIGPLMGPEEDRIPLRRGSDRHLMMTTYINGKSIEMMFDTGASATVMSIDAWKSLGNPAPTGKPIGYAQGVGGVVPIWKVTATVGLGKMSRKMDVQLLEEMSSNGLIGQTFFNDMQYNLSGDCDYIHVFKKGSAAAARSIPLNTINVPFRLTRNEMLVTANINGHPIEMTFDTGAFAILIDVTSISDADIHIPKDAQIVGLGGVGGSKAAFQLKVDSIKLGDVEKRNVDVLVSNSGANLLGQPFFRDLRYVIDNDNKLIKFFH